MKPHLVISVYLLSDGSLYHPKQLHIYCVYMHSWRKVTHEDDSENTLNWKSLQ